MPLVTDKNYYLHEKLKEELDFLNKANDKKWDVWGIIDGVEGVAKTTLATSIAYYLNYISGAKLPFGIKNVVYTADQFFEAVDTQPNKTVILWDEFVLGGLSTDAMSKIQKAIISKAVTMRKKQMFVLLLIPYVFLLRRYFAIARTRFMIHVDSPDGISRGHFKYYGYRQKKELFLRGFKSWDYDVARYDFKGNFKTDIAMEHNLFFDNNEYDKKKEKAILSASEEKASPMLELAREQRNKFFLMLLGQYSQAEISKVTRINQSQCSKIYSGIKGKEEDLLDYRSIPHKTFQMPKKISFK